MGKSSNQKQAEANNLAIQKQQLAALQQANAHQQALFNMVQPFGQSALQFGQSALQGKVPNQFLLPIRNQISSSFDQSRQNLAEALGQSGQQGSGISAGPLANLEQQQGVASGNATLQALLQGLGIGFQGSNVLAGQQSIFNPSPLAQSGSEAGNTVIQAPGAWGQQLLGGVAAGLAGSAGTIATAAKGCWVAAELYGGWFSPETCAIRNWIWSTWWMKPFAWFYLKFGQTWAEAIKKHGFLRRSTKRLFDFFLERAWAKA